MEPFNLRLAVALQKAIPNWTIDVQRIEGSTAHMVVLTGEHTDQRVGVISDTEESLDIDSEVERIKGEVQKALDSMDKHVAKKANEPAPPPGPGGVQILHVIDPKTSERRICLELLNQDDKPLAHMELSRSEAVKFHKTWGDSIQNIWPNTNLG